MITVQKVTIPYREGMTVAEALKQAGEQVTPTTLVVAEGSVLPFEKLHHIKLDDGAKLQLHPILSGG